MRAPGLSGSSISSKVASIIPSRTGERVLPETGLRPSFVLPEQGEGLVGKWPFTKPSG